VRLKAKGVCWNTIVLAWPAKPCSFPRQENRGIARVLNSLALTVYKFDYSDVDEKPEMLFMCLKRLVGERGFEPPTPWSRTRFGHLLKSVGICGLQAIVVEPVAGASLKFVDSC
jgi:hypothetical protein